MRYNILRLGLIFTVLLSCSVKDTEHTKTYQPFPKSFQLKGEIILENELAALGAYQVDSLLLLYVRKMPHFFSVYHSKSLRPLGKIGIRGEAPHEWKGAFFVAQSSLEDGQHKLWINERSKSQMIQLNLTESLKKQTTIQDTVFSYKPQLELGSYIFPISERKWIANQAESGEDKGRMLIYQPIDQTSILVNLYPALAYTKKLPKPILHQLYADHWAIKPDKSLLVSAMLAFNRIDIFDTEGNLKYSYEGKIAARQPTLSEKQLLEGDLSEMMLHYVEVVATERFIYALYIEQKEYEYGDKPKYTEIHVFDWTAQPIAKFDVPDYLSSFAIDEQNKQIIGINFFEEKILSYDLPNFE